MRNVAITKKFWDPKDKTVKVKICGVNSLEIAYEIAEIGSDAIGFHIWNNWKRDRIDCYIKQIRYILRFLPSSLSCWLVSDIVDPTLMCEMLNKVNFDTLQIQGKVPLREFLNLLNALESIIKRRKIRIVKSIAMGYRSKEEILESIKSYLPFVDGLLLDSRWKGGSGITNYNWSLAAEIVREIQKPVILAGGLNPQNVAEAISIVSPYGVDVETGVETIVGHYRRKKIKCKSILKVREFIMNAKMVKR